MTVTAASKVENPTNVTSLSSTPSNSGKSAALSGGGVSKGKPVEKMQAGEDGGGEFNDVKKKIRRAERFGVPVQLSEQEKRNSRAERFGSGAVGNGIDTSKQSEELKKKARAERFGITHSDAADEDSKKQARLARFGSVSSYDSAEEEKKKARALRFLAFHSSLLLLNVPLRFSVIYIIQVLVAMFFL